LLPQQNVFGEIIRTWRIANATPVKYEGLKLTGKGTDVGIEELVLTSERIEQG
jgi:hypothetical protein